MKLSSTSFLLASLSALHLASARKVNLVWRNNSGYWRFRTERSDGDMMGGSDESLQIPLTFDGKVEGNNKFWVYVLTDPTRWGEDSTKIVECTINGQLKAGLEETTFTFQDGTNFLKPCKAPEGIEVVCETPIRADCNEAGW